MQYEVWTKHYLQSTGRRLEIDPFPTRERAEQHVNYLIGLAASRSVSLGTMTYEVRPVADSNAESAPLALPPCEGRNPHNGEVCGQPADYRVIGSGKAYCFGHLPNPVLNDRSRAKRL